MSYINLNVRGNIYHLDPKSKIVLSFLMVIGVATSLEPFQVFCFAVLSIPIYFLYKPKLKFLKKFLLSLPFMLVIVMIFLLSIDDDVTVHVLWFQRTYEPEEFVILVAYRFAISVLHSSILLESEERAQDLIDAFASFKINENFVTILLLISTIAQKLQTDYSKMLMAAKSKGGLSNTGIASFMFKLRILSNVLVRSSRHSDNIGDTLTARGFSGKFTSKSRGWTSEGLTVLGLGIGIFLLITISPFLRPH